MSQSKEGLRHLPSPEKFPKFQVSGEIILVDLLHGTFLHLLFDTPETGSAGTPATLIIPKSASCA